MQMDPKLAQVVTYIKGERRPGCRYHQRQTHGPTGDQVAGDRECPDGRFDQRTKADEKPSQENEYALDGNLASEDEWRDVRSLTSLPGVRSAAEYPFQQPEPLSRN